MSIWNKKMMPEVQEKGKRGFYPVVNKEEWEKLPCIYKAMDWFPIEVPKLQWDGKIHREKSFVKEVVFDCIYIEPYGVRGKLYVHRENFQKIMFCYYGKTDCHLYSVCGVKFENGEEWSAEWKQDTRTGAYALYSNGHCLARQGGFMGYIPESVTETENGYEYNQNYYSEKHECISHYSHSNPFRN